MSQPILIKPKGGGVQDEATEDAEQEVVEEDDEGQDPNGVGVGGDIKRVKLDEEGKAKPVISPAAAMGMTAKEYKAFMRQYDNTYIAIWKDMSRKDGPKVSRLMQQSTQAKLINHRKTCILAAREAKRWQIRNTKNQKDLTTKARRAMREMFNFWKRNERIERDLKKKHEKELLDKAKKEEEEREAKRQARKLNFLITQTELYSHFIGKKIKTDEIEGSDADGTFKAEDKKHLDKYTDVDGSASHDINNVDFDNDDEEALHRMAAENAQNALVNAQNKAKQFDNDEPFKNPDTNGEEMNFQNPTLLGDLTVPQPNMLKCTLKEYQLKGLNWLANLYEQGINGILADEMGLGKTVQSISVLSYLAETHNIWGPFLVVTPASTLHNWQQEITKFVPDFKVLPYWGNAKDRKILRKFWDRKSVRYDKDAPFHVLVTSYQLIVADIAYFQKMKWQYMILDEAQAIKSSSSSRWKSLLSLSCRNRLLLTGTPIQNSMQELWALLHFIMPTLFDSHDEFSDWFSKDIESHAQSNTGLDEQQLRRLHMILKPFMLRRIKKNVQSELGDKDEIDIFCNLTTRQKKLYLQLRSQISISDSDLLDSATTSSDSSLANLVMQFRKVCNHPDLFERADVKSPFSFGKFAETGSFLRESNELEMAYSTENVLDYQLPRLIYDELLCPNYGTNSRDSIYAKFDIYSPENTTDHVWLKSIDVSPGELKKLSQQDILTRAIDLQSYAGDDTNIPGRINYLYEGDYVPANKRLLITEYNKTPRSNSSVLTDLYSVIDLAAQDMYLNNLEPAANSIASAPPITVSCSSRNFATKINDALFDKSIRSSLVPLSLSNEVQLMKDQVPLSLYPKSNLLPRPVFDYSDIRMPSMERFIADCGKLARLDELLVDLKRDGHRVLIYFQMTKMMELFQEYLAYRSYQYIRLDGSTTIESRREMVSQWQSNDDIFIFMLSTRAGGLGLNLTSADTVIFYDSDWNPTIDAQAMDRAHRIGQTKKVTVYRLLTKNTIEERIRQKAQNKEEIQKLVINQ
ncbi:INO80 Chromatin-remodeling ATPase INO80 [Candida maltosa Xu316]